MAAYSAVEARPLKPKLESYRDQMRENAALHAAWVEFVDIGHYLDERADGEPADGQRELWNEPSQRYNNDPIGVVFAKNAELVSILIGDEIKQIRTAYLSAGAANNPAP